MHAVRATRILSCARLSFRRSISQSSIPKPVAVVTHQSPRPGHVASWRFGVVGCTPSMCYSNEAPEKHITKRQQTMQNLRKVLKEYGTVAVVFHTVISLTSLGICYMTVKSGIDVEKLFVYFNINIDSIGVGKTASTMGVAYILHKVFMPVRAFITISSVPLIVRYLRAKGIMRPAPKQTS